MARRLACLVLALGSSASAAGAPVPASDKRFLTEAAQGGLLEVQLGSLASRKGTLDDVTQFGQRMVAEHSALNDQLKALASQKGVTLPTALDKTHKQQVERLNMLRGPSFDREYIRTMVSDHEKDVAHFSKAASSAHDADVRAFADSALPMLKDHLQAARDIETRMSAGVGGAAQGGSSAGHAPVAPSRPQADPE